MSLSTKIIIAISAILLICFGGFVIMKQIDTVNQLTLIQKSIVEQKQLLDNISRAQAQYVSKGDLEAFAKQQNIDLSVIQKDLDSLNAQVQAISGITIVSKEQKQTNLPSTTTTPGENPTPVTPGSDPFGYLSNTQHLSLNEKFSNTDVPFANVSFSAWRGKPWDLSIAERKYSITSVLGVDSKNKHYMYNKFAIQTSGKTYDIKIDDNKFLEEMPQSTFKWFNPQLFLGIDGAINISRIPLMGEFSPHINLGIMTYGKFDNQPDLSILQVGIGYGITNKTPQVVISPIQYNVGNNIPLMHNLYIGPSIQIGINGDIGIGAGLKVGL